MKITDIIKGHKERRYTHLDYVRDMKLAEDKSAPAPCPPGMFCDHELGHVALDGGGTIYMLREELHEYFSSLLSLYSITETDYRRLKDAGVLSNAEKKRVLRRRKPMIEVGFAHQQRDAGVFSGRETKTYFTESEARAEIQRVKQEPLMNGDNNDDDRPA